MPRILRGDHRNVAWVGVHSLPSSRMDASAARLPHLPSVSAGRLPRLTVATIVPDGDRFLFVEERVRGRLVVNQPAGHLEPGESLAEAAVRETLEETGWHIQVTGLVAV